MAIEVMGSAAVSQDVIIDQVREKYNCRVLKCEGRPVLEYTSELELDQITEYVRQTFHRDLLDVFFTAIPSLQPDE